MILLQGPKGKSEPLILHGTVTTRRMFAPLDSSPLLIISFRLKSLTEIGNPPVLTFHDLYQWFPTGQVVYVDVPFNLDTKGGQARFERKVTSVVKRLVEGDLKMLVVFESFTLTTVTNCFGSFKRFLIFISTHSEPDEGWLHSEGESGGAISVKNVCISLLKVRDV